MSEAATSAGSTCARSTTRPVRGGTSRARAKETKVEVKAEHKARKSIALELLWLSLDLSLNLSLLLEFHLWRLSHSLFIRHGEVRLLFQMEEELGRQVRGEIADAFVVLRHFLDVALARDGNAILCPF